MKRGPRLRIQKPWFILHIALLLKFRGAAPRHLLGKRFPILADLVPGNVTQTCFFVFVFKKKES